MFRKAILLILASVMILATAACSHNKTKNPIANLNSKQPDKVLYDRAMDDLKHGRYDVARITLQTLINTYSDSEYIARAKLSVGDSWYAEGTTAALAQAEAEYKDFITFFPKMPEAAEAQLKVANIHYRQMEKADRDYTHAKRAEEEYRELIQQFSDSKLVPEAKKRLLEVQEVLAEREFRIGRFYFLRESWPAAIARLKSLSDAYPLYSHADEALFMLGNAYEGEIELIRENIKMAEVAKAKLIADFSQSAATAYAKILTRYPLMPRAGDAKQHLEALHQPIPAASAAAIAQNKAEEDSRSETNLRGRLMLNFKRSPDVAAAAKTGEPTMTDPDPTSAPEILRNASKVAEGTKTGTGSVTIEQVGKGEPAPNEATPRSEPSSNDKSAPELSVTPTTAPSQVNEAQTPDSQAAAKITATDSTDTRKDSTSKKKKKSVLRKLIPF